MEERHPALEGWLDLVPARRRKVDAAKLLGHRVRFTMLVLGDSAARPEG
jgi:hypothetical protein